MLFFKKKNPLAAASSPVSYDPDRQEPVLRCSICNGEQVAGFRDLETGAFTEVMFIRTEADLAAFRAQYGIGDRTLRKIY